MTTTRRLLAALILSVFALVGFASVASAATPSHTVTKTTWNAKHTVKTTVSHTTRVTGTTDTTTVTKYAPKVAKKAQVKLSAHKVSISISTRKDGSVSHKVTTTDTTYNTDGSVKTETQTVDVIS